MEKEKQTKKKYKVQIGDRMASAAVAFAVGFAVAAIVLIPIIYWLSGR